MFKEAYAAGRRESAGAYRLDALARLLEGGGAKVETTVVVRVDETRLRGQGGTCASEAGPVPVELAIGEILAGAFVKIVATDGTDIAKVHHVGLRARRGQDRGRSSATAAGASGLDVARPIVSKRTTTTSTSARTAQRTTGTWPRCAASITGSSPTAATDWRVGQATGSGSSRRDAQRQRGSDVLAAYARQSA
ncbi:MAG: hypothetical protein H0W70_14105 [Actinobacteria bacterium]|nr:hypothetical protein [Actinomycetota bacterium]